MDANALLETGIDNWNSWRSRQPQTPLDLSKQNLSHGYFFEGDFRGVNLKGANLQRACLIGADLRQADLTGADLTGAYLGDTNLAGANLSQANLKDANLDRADLRRTNLMGAQIANADLRIARLPDPKVDPYTEEIVYLLTERRVSARPDASTWSASKRTTEVAYSTASYRRSLLRQMIDRMPIISRESDRLATTRQQAIRQSAALIAKPAKVRSATPPAPLQTAPASSAIPKNNPQSGKARQAKLTGKTPWGRRQSDKTLLGQLARLQKQLVRQPPWIAAGLVIAIGLPTGLSKLTAPPISAQEIASFALAKSLAGSSRVWAVATQATTSGQPLVIGGGENGRIEIWDGENGELIRNFQGHSGPVRALAMSDSGRWLVSGGQDGVKVWETTTGKLRYTLPEAQTAVSSVAVSPDEQTLISSDRNGNIMAWQLSTGKQLYKIEEVTPVWSVAIAPDGQSFVAGGSISGTSASNTHTVKQWNLASGQLIREFIGHSDTVRSVAISPDGQTLASGSSDQTIKLWDLASGNLKTTLSGHKDGILSLAISPDGQTLASSSRDQTLKLWNIPNAQLAKTVENNPILALAFDPTQPTLVSGGQDQRVRLWY